MSLPFSARLVNRLTPHQRGWLAEKLALTYFLVHGFAPAPRRWRQKVQTDLLMVRGQTLVLVEVKFRQTEQYGHIALSPVQRRRLQQAARWLVGTHPGKTIRADVVLVFPHWPFLRHLPAAIALDAPLSRR